LSVWILVGLVLLLLVVLPIVSVFVARGWREGVAYLLWWLLPL
jgi:hypothetical protein